MNLLIVNTGLFPDAQTVDAALRRTVPPQSIEAIDLARRDLQEADWDAAIQAIVAADRVVSI